MAISYENAAVIAAFFISTDNQQNNYLYLVLLLSLPAMKKNFLIHLLMLLIIVCIASCQNDDAPMQQENTNTDTISNPINDTVTSPPGTVILPPVPIDSVKVVKKMIQNGGIYTFAYDSQNNLAGIHTGDSYYTKGLSVFYNSANKPYKSNLRVSNSYITDNREYFFDGDFLTNQKVYDSQNVLMMNRNFTYNSDGLLTSFTVTVNEIIYLYTYTYDSFGNVSESEAVSETVNGRKGYTYDNANNPFKNMPYYLTTIFMGSMPIVSDVTSFVNNPTQMITYDGAGNITDLINYTYEYDADNFPTKRTATSEGNIIEIVDYEYQYNYIY